MLRDLSAVGGGSDHALGGGRLLWLLLLLDVLSRRRVLLRLLLPSPASSCVRSDDDKLPLFGNAGGRLLLASESHHPAGQAWSTFGCRLPGRPLFDFLLP